jgi:hypothetical protein
MRVLSSLLLLLLLAACPQVVPPPLVLTDGEGDGAGDGEGDSGEGEGNEGEGESPSGAGGSSVVRRLSRVELANTFRSLFGEVPAALDAIPLDSQGLTYDRMVDAQTISPAHLDAFSAVVEELSTMLLANRRLDELSASCGDDIAPPAATASTVRTPGAGLSASPSWAIIVGQGDPTRLLMQYATEATFSLTHPAPAAGRYEVSFGLEIVSPTIDAMVVHANGVEVQTLTNFDTESRRSVIIDVAAAGPVQLQFDLSGGDNMTFFIDDVTVVGPLDDGAAQVEARRACAAGLLADFVPSAWRRPLTANEIDRLLSLYDDGAVTDATTGMRMLLAGVLLSPHFLYLIEVGSESQPGWWLLSPHELAARLSYALCESPPDAQLRAAADAGALNDEEVDAQVRRLLDSPCGQEAVQRFFGQWLWLDKLPTLNRDTTVFPELTSEVRAGLAAESRRYVDEMVFGEQASLSTLLAAPYAWPDARSAFLANMSAATDSSVPMPEERAGILGLPGLLTATGIFDGTSPVHRGVFVLKQLLCQELSPPPPELMVAPPPPDPTATTRERWRQHSDSEACSSCHTAIDPIGFALEGFDGLGRHRLTENGQPVDDSGGIPTIGVADGDIHGEAELARTIASSPVVTDCFARQWLRFSLGRLDTTQDQDSIDVVTAALLQGSIREALMTVTTTTAFRHRTQEVSP